MNRDKRPEIDSAQVLYELLNYKICKKKRVLLVIRSKKD